ncbi:MAG: flagellar FliJ family protein [Alphaproteobacteria bacterium]|nr:flagellar FliJ family protein [Alphaproteobacteria bacterium]
MADLDPLIRFRKYGVDEKQRLLAQLYREYEALDQQKQQIESRMDRESELARSMGTAEAMVFLGAYLEGARKRCKILESSMAKMDARIALAQEDMRQAFAEMKKVSIVARRRRDALKTAQSKKESQMFDETAIDRYRREITEEPE